jgi:hypothetical protein
MRGSPRWDDTKLVAIYILVHTFFPYISRPETVREIPSIDLPFSFKDIYFIHLFEIPSSPGTMSAQP